MPLKTTLWLEPNILYVHVKEVFQLNKSAPIGEWKRNSLTFKEIMKAGQPTNQQMDMRVKMRFTLTKRTWEEKVL